MITWTLIQKQRLQELNASEKQLSQSFNSEKERNSYYQETEKQLVSRAKADLESYRSEIKEPPLVAIEAKLSEALIEGSHREQVSKSNIFNAFPAFPCFCAA